MLLQRVEAKDYLDIAGMVRAGFDLARGLAGARALYGDAFQPSESLKAMVYFEGGDLQTVRVEDRVTLVAAAAGVRHLPTVPILSRHLTA